MKKFDRNDMVITMYIIWIVICALILIGYVFLYVYCMVKYGNTPISELPSWAYFILYNGGSSR